MRRAAIAAFRSKSARVFNGAFRTGNVIYVADLDGSRRFVANSRGFRSTRGCDQGYAPLTGIRLFGFNAATKLVKLNATSVNGCAVLPAGFGATVNLKKNLCAIA